MGKNLARNPIIEKAYRSAHKTICPRLFCDSNSLEYNSDIPPCYMVVFCLGQVVVLDLKFGFQFFVTVVSKLSVTDINSFIALLFCLQMSSYRSAILTGRYHDQM